MFTDLGLYLVDSLIICVRLRASSLDFRTAGVLSISQFCSPVRTLKIDGGDQFTYGVKCTNGGRGGSITSGNGKRIVSGKVDF